MLKVRNLSAFEHGNAILSEISFEVKRGEIVALIGPNYSGKSLLLRALAGGFRHLEGDCRVNSYNLEREPKHYKSQIGFASPLNRPEPYLTGLEWLEIIGTAYALPPKKRVATILALAEALDAKDDLYRLVDQAGPAATQKVSLIGSLFHKPTVALWDEPTQFLDPSTQVALAALARSFASDGGSLLLASNHLEWAERVADRYILMDDGQIVAEGTLARLRNSYRSPERSLTSVFQTAFHD